MCCTGKEAVDHFQTQSIVTREIREGQNEAEWMIRLCMEVSALTLCRAKRAFVKPALSLRCFRL